MMRCVRGAVLVVAIMLVLSISLSAVAQDDPNEVVKAELKKLSFIIGHWNTLSTVVSNGLEAPGDLSYEYVLGDTYILCRFVGRHPERPVWEACELITWDAGLGAYAAYAFPSPEGPVRYIGRWTADDTVCFTLEKPDANGRTDRISYTGKPDGTVFQLNEITFGDGEWKPALRTIYTTK